MFPSKKPSRANIEQATQKLFSHKLYKTIQNHKAKINYSWTNNNRYYSNFA